MGFLSSIFGKKPKVPAFTPVDLDKEQLAQIEANRRVVGPAGDLSKAAQAADQEALMQGLRTAMPNYDELLKSEYDITKSMLSGTLTDDAKRRMRDRRAALGLATGQMDSQGTQYSYARDLGLAEMDLQRQGMAYADNRIRRQSQFVAAPMSVQSMFFTPQQRIAQKMSERDSKFNRDYAQAKIDAAPSPVASGLFNAGMTLATAGMMGGMGGAAAAGAKGGMAGKLLGSAVGYAAGGPLGGFLGGYMGGGGGIGGIKSFFGYGQDPVGITKIPAFSQSGGSGLGAPTADQNQINIWNQKFNKN